MRILLARHDKDRYHFRLGYFVIFATNQIPRVGCPPRKMRLQDTNRRFFAFLKTTLHRCWTAQVSDYHGINCFHLFFYMGGAGWPYHSYQNVFSHRGHGLWSQQEEKEQHRRECFFASGVFTGVIWSVASWKYLWAVVRIETNGVLRVLVSLEWDGIWEITGSWSNFWCCPVAALNGNEKRMTFAPFFFFVSSWDGLYICPLFVFLFMD